MLRVMLSELLERPLTEITRDYVMDRQQELLGSGMAASTVTTNTKTVKAFVRWLYENEHLEADPFRRKLKALRVERTAKAPDERDKYLFERACAESADLAIACCVMLALNCGLRRGETQALKRRTSPRKRTIYIAARQSKTSRSRVVVVPKSVVAFLEGAAG